MVQDISMIQVAVCKCHYPGLRFSLYSRQGDWNPGSSIQAQTGHSADGPPGSPLSGTNPPAIGPGSRLETEHWSWIGWGQELAARIRTRKHRVERVRILPYCSCLPRIK